ERGADGKATGPRELIDDLAAIAWQGRTVYIVFDSDAVSNSNVAWAEHHLAEELAGLGAMVKIVRLPHGETKVGLEDFLVAHPREELQRLIEGAAAPEPPARDPATEMPNEAHDDPHRLARLYLDEYRARDANTIRYWCDDYYRWDGRAY